jgi:hypothetical protein
MGYYNIHLPKKELWQSHLKMAQKNEQKHVLCNFNIEIYLAKIDVMYGLWEVRIIS